jgi:hypothetical protein
MSGITRSQQYKGFPRINLEKLPFPAVWSLKQEKAEASSLILTEDEPLPPSRRLVVIVPDASFDTVNLPRRIWNLAAPDHREVLLLARPSQEENEFHLRMTLTSLAAQIRDARAAVQTQVIMGKSFAFAARQYAQPDDVFVCFEEHRAPAFLKKKIWLKDQLAQSVHRPVYTLKGPVTEIADPISSHLIEIVLLVIALLTLIGFFALQVWIDKNATGSFHTVLEILTLIVEAWIISVCAKRSIRI